MRTLPAIAIVIPIYTMFRDLKLLDTYWALILVYPVYMTPLVAWIMVGFFREVPREMEEAALIDGCSQWGLFWRIVVPVAAPGLVAVAILNFIGGWNEFLFALILTSRDIQTTPVATAGFSTNKGILWGRDGRGRRHRLDPGHLCSPSSSRNAWFAASPSAPFSNEPFNHINAAHSPGKEASRLSVGVAADHLGHR